MRKFEFKNRILFERLANPSHFDSSFSNPLLRRAPQRISKTLTFRASVSLKTTMSASKAKSTRKHQRSDSEFAVSDKRNRVEDDFDLDLSKLVTSNSNTILFPLFFFVWIFFFNLFIEIAVISKALCRRCIRSERRLRRTARRRTKRLFPGNTKRFPHSD